MSREHEHAVADREAAAPAGRREVALAGAAFLALAVLFLARGLPGDTAPVCTDPLYADAQAVPYRAARPADFAPHNAYLSDHVNVFYPWLHFMSAAVRRGEVPFWSPESSAGLPFLANLSAALFFPTTWLTFLPPDLLPVARGMLWGAVLRLFLAGWFGYLLLRRIGLRRPAAAAGGAGMMLFGYQVVWLFYSLTNVSCLLPLCLYVTQRFAERPDARRGLVLALALAVQFLGGHAETSLALAIACVAWFAQAAASPSAPRPFVSMALRFAGWSAASIALCAFQLLPFVDYLLRSEGRAEREALREPSRDLWHLGTAGGASLVLLALAGAILTCLGLRRGSSIGQILVERAPLLRRPLFRRVSCGAIVGAGAAVAVLALQPLGLRLTPLLQLLDADLFGSPLRAEGYRGPEFYPDVVGGYAGALLALLALLAVAASPRRRLVGAMVAIAGFALALVGHVEPVHALVKSFPPFDIAADTRMLPLLGVATPVLGALAIDAMRAHRAALREAAARLLVAAPVAIAWVVGALPSGGMAPFRISSHTPGPEAFQVWSAEGAIVRPRIDERGRGKLVVPIAARVPPGATSLQVDVGASRIFDGPVTPGATTLPWDATRLPAGSYVLHGAALDAEGRVVDRDTSRVDIDRSPAVTGAGRVRIALAVGLIALLLLGAGWVAWLAPLFVAAELFLFGFAYNAFVPEATVFPPTGLTDFLAAERARWEAEGRGPPRVLCEDTILQPNQHYAYDLHLLRGYDQLEVADYHKALRNMPAFHAARSPGAWNRDTVDLESPWIDWLGVAFLVTGTALDAPGWELAHEGPDGLVYRNLAASPRAFLVGRALDFTAAPPAELFSADPREVAFVEGSAPTLDGGGAARVVRYGLNEVEVSVDAAGKSLLVLTDAMFPGWTAEVDGRKTPIVPVSFAFRGVEVPPGRATVVFRYRSRGFREGLAVAAAVAALALLLVRRRGAVPAVQD